MNILRKNNLNGSPISKPLRVVSIAHTGINRAIGRMRYEPLARRSDLELTLIVPATWREYGRILKAEPPSHGLDLRITPVRWTRAAAAEWYLHHYVGLGKILRECRPDVIHLWEEPWSVVALQATWLRGRFLPNAKLILETDQNILRRLPPPFQQIRRATLERTDLLITRQPEAEQVARVWGYRGPTAIVEYGVDETVFHPRSRDTGRDDLGIAGFLIGYVGRIVLQKGLLDVLDALAQSDDRISFALLGGGPGRAAFDAHAKRLGIEHRVRVFDPASPEKVADFMRALDVLILMSRTTPTWKEQFGRVIIEAQACGTPVIGSSSGAIPSVIGNGGWVVPEGDALSLSKLLDSLRANPVEVSHRASLARANVASRFTYARVAETLLGVYQAAASARCSPVSTQTGLTSQTKPLETSTEAASVLRKRL